MYQSYSRVEPSRCLKTENSDLKYFDNWVCLTCKMVPLPPMKDQLNLTKIYCVDCCNNQGIKTTLRQSKNEILFLENLKIDCVNNCGEVFSYFTLNELEFHESKCIKKKPIDEFNNIQIKSILDSIAKNDQKFNEFQRIISQFFDKFDNKLNTFIANNDSLKSEINEKILEINKKQDRLISDSEKSKKAIFSTLTKTNLINFTIISTQNYNNYNFDSKSNENLDIYEEIIREEDIQINSLDEKFDSALKKSDKTVCLNIVNEKITNFENKISNENSLFKELKENDTILENLSAFKQSYQLISTTNDEKIYKSQIETLNQNLNVSLSTPSFGNIRNIINRGKHILTLEALCMVIYKKSTLIIGSSDNSIELWNIDTQVSQGSITRAHDNWINSIILLKNSNLMVSGSGDCKIKFWNIDRLKEDSNEILNETSVNHIIQYDNNTIIVASFDSSIKYYDIYTKALKMKINSGHQRFIRRLILVNSNNKEFLITLSSDSTIKIWDNNKCLDTLRNHKDEVQSVIQLNSNKNILVTSDQQSEIIFWNINENFKEIKRLICQDIGTPSYCVQLLEWVEKKILISCSRRSTLIFWNLLNYEQIRKINSKFSILCMISLENEDGLIFNVKSDIIIWK